MEKLKFDLNEYVDAALEAERNAPKTYTSKPGIKPSELGSPCLRKNYYGYHKVPSTFPWEAPNILAADAGDAFHSMFRKQLKQAGLLIENLDPKTLQVPVSFIDRVTPDPEFPVTAPDLGIRYAKADGLILVPPGTNRSGLWALEIKSKKSDKMKYVKGPDRDRYQGTLYAFLLEEQLREGKLAHIPRLKGETEIRGTVYVYINRDSNERRVFWDEKDERMMGDIIAKCLLILEHVQAKTLPPKTEDFCPWCSWRDKCAIEWKVE